MDDHRNHVELGFEHLQVIIKGLYSLLLFFTRNKLIFIKKKREDSCSVELPKFDSR